MFRLDLKPFGRRRMLPLSLPLRLPVRLHPPFCPIHLCDLNFFFNPLCVCFSPPNPHPTLQAEEAAQPVSTPSGPWAVWEGINVCCSLITAPLVGDEAEPRHLLSPASPPSYIPLLVKLHVSLCSHPDVQCAHSRVLLFTGAHRCVSVSSEMSCADADLIFLQICSTFFTFFPQLSTGCGCTLMNKWIN